jgi:heptaprenyl diphosphate synthase
MELIDVKRLMKKNFKSSEEFFEESVTSMVDAGGKMLRPAFLLLSGKFGQYDKEKMINLAAVIETLHLATLIHDDIVDESKLRRGVETVQSKHGKEFAVYSGDFLFCQCFNMLSAHDYTKENLRNISKAMSKICMGEIRQNSLRYKMDINFKNYIKVISGKTAALFAISFYAGAVEGKCDEILSKNLARIGYNIGMAFQIKDDLLDFTSKKSVIGKEAKMDMIRGYYTLPLLFALRKDEEQKISRILKNSNLSDEDIKEVINLSHEYGAIKKAEGIADKYTIRALKAIRKLPESDHKEIIKEVVVKLLGRNY